MRVPNDVLLAEKSTMVDIFLGGHDHVSSKKHLILTNLEDLPP